MNPIIEKIKSLLGLNATIVRVESPPLDFVKSKKSILRELVFAKQSGNLIGIYCSALGEGMFLTGVEAIEPAMKDEVIVFGQYDLSGKILLRTELALEEIQMVCPFNKPYRSPFFRNGKDEKIVDFAGHALR
jgi:hypothetical protein